MLKKPSKTTDVGLGAVLILISLVIMWGLKDLPPGTFEPLGSFSVPFTIAGLIIFFSIIIIIKALGNGSNKVAEKKEFRPRGDLALQLIAATVVYALVMAMEWVSFSIATLFYLLLTINLLGSFKRRYWLLSLIVSLVLGFGLEFLFTKVFVIDLP